MSDPGRVRVPEKVQGAQVANAPATTVSTKKGNAINLGAQVLIELTGVSPEVVERAERIRGKMENPSPLGDVLVKMGGLTPDDLEQAKQRHMARMSVAEILRARGQLTDKAIEVYRKRME